MGDFILIIGLLFLLVPEKQLPNYKIEITEDSIVRNGKGYQFASILFKDISKIKKGTTGYLIVKKGFTTKMKFFTRRTVGVYDNDIIWIPYIIENVDSLIMNVRNKQNK